MKVKVVGVPFGQLPLTSVSLMREVGELALRLIRTRTEKGISYDGSPFQPLSPGYASQKRKALGHDRADLTVSGRMLNDMDVTQVTETSATIGFRSSGPGARGGTFIQRSRSVGAADKAFYHEDGGRVLRKFFDLSEDEEQEVQDAVERYLDRVIGG